MADEIDPSRRLSEREAFLKEYVACRDAMAMLPVDECFRQLAASVDALLFLRMENVHSIAFAVAAFAQYWDGERLWSGGESESMSAYAGRKIGWYAGNSGSQGSYSDFYESDPGDQPFVWRTELEALLDGCVTCQPFVAGALRDGDNPEYAVEILPAE